MATEMKYTMRTLPMSARTLRTRAMGTGTMKTHMYNEKEYTQYESNKSEIGLFLSGRYYSHRQILRILSKNKIRYRGKNMKCLAQIRVFYWMDKIYVVFRISEVFVGGGDPSCRYRLQKKFRLV